MFGIQIAIATLAPIASCFQLLPQLHKTYTTKNVKDLSFYTLLLIFTSNLLWTLHGYFIEDTALISSGFINFAIIVPLLWLYIKYHP
jgi:uncharacterized protein with PQ loop repeat